MLNFPNITAPSYPFTEEPEDTSIISKFEDGSQQSRPKFTRSRNKYTLSWEQLSQEEYGLLMDFIKNQAKFSAVAFNWKHPSNHQTLEVRITSVGQWKQRMLKYWSGSLELTEV